MRKNPHLGLGFTLLELMVAIAVFALLLGIGVPTFSSIINANRITTQANELVSALNYARSEAVKRSEPVAVCASADGATCAASTDWSTGWIVFDDRGGVVGAPDAATDVLQIWPGTGGLVLDSGVNFVRYAGTGMSTTATTFELYKSSCTGEKARTISIAVTGRVSSAKSNCP
jgi:type IV fimbrial biogenesis protein FimT